MFRVVVLCDNDTKSRSFTVLVQADTLADALAAVMIQMSVDPHQVLAISRIRTNYLVADKATLTANIRF